MQQKTFGKRGLATHARGSSPTNIKRPTPQNLAKSGLVREATSESVLDQTATPASVPSFYIPESEPSSGSTLGGAAKKGYETLFGLVVLVALVAAGISMCQPSTADRERSAQVSAANREKGFHCLSRWDGSHTGFVRSVKNEMRDPNSFEHGKTAITPVKGGKHTIIMDYRGRNGFGGMNAEVAVGVIRYDDCRLLEWSNR